MPSSALFVFAHPDDEYAISTMIEAELTNGREILCAYLTDGSANENDPAIRRSESLSALASLGVCAKNVAFIGIERHIADGRLHKNTEEAFRALKSWLEAQSSNVDRVYMLAWEGGHVDHDAAHIIGLAIAKDFGVEVDCIKQYPIYRAFRGARGLFRVISPLRENGEVRVRRLSIGQAIRAAFLCRFFASQRRSWLGLFPESFVKLMLLRREVLQGVRYARILERPHDGELFYEVRFGIPWDEFKASVRPFIISHFPDLSEPI